MDVQIKITLHPTLTLSAAIQDALAALRQVVTLEHGTISITSGITRSATGETFVDPKLLLSGAAVVSPALATSSIDTPPLVVKLPSNGSTLLNAPVLAVRPSAILPPVNANDEPATDVKSRALPPATDVKSRALPPPATTIPIAQNACARASTVPVSIPIAQNACAQASTVPVPPIDSNSRAPLPTPCTVTSTASVPTLKVEDATNKILLSTPCCALTAHAVGVTAPNIDAKDTKSRPALSTACAQNVSGQASTAASDTATSMPIPKGGCLAVRTWQGCDNRRNQTTESNKLQKSELEQTVRRSRFLFRGVTCVQEETAFCETDACYSALVVDVSERSKKSRLETAQVMAPQMNALLDRKPKTTIKSWWGGNQPFFGYRDALVQRYKNSYAGLMKDVQDVIDMKSRSTNDNHCHKQAKWDFYSPWVKGYELKKACNPFVSTSSLLDTAVAYGRGKMLTGKDQTVSRNTPRRPQYDKSGIPKHSVIGHVQVFCTPDHTSGIDIENYTGGPIKLKARLKKEGETAFLVYVPPDFHMLTVPLCVPPLDRFDPAIHARYGLSAVDVDHYRGTISAQVDSVDHGAEAAFCVLLESTHLQHVRDAIWEHCHSFLPSIERTWLSL